MAERGSRWRLGGAARVARGGLFRTCFYAALCAAAECENDVPLGPREGLRRCHCFGKFPRRKREGIHFFKLRFRPIRSVNSLRR